MLLSTLGASLLGNILTGKGINRAGEGVLRACYGNNGNNKMVIPPHALTNLEIQNIIKMNQDLMVFIPEIIYLNTVPLK